MLDCTLRLIAGGRSWTIDTLLLVAPPYLPDSASALYPRPSCPPPPCSHSTSGGFKSFLDSYCGLCIVVLYYMYLNVVKGALSVFDCSKNKDGVWILDADPSIKCYVVSPRGD